MVKRILSHSLLIREAMIAKLPESPLIRRLLPVVALSVMALGLSIQNASAETPAETAQRTETPSGYPVPRFVAIAGVPTNCRTGPSKSHPVKYTFQREGVPVRVIAETRDYWLKIEDIDGDVCWAHQSVLKGNRRAIALGDVDLRASPKRGAPVRVRLRSGVVGDILKDDGPWVLVRVEDARGWAEASAFWGLASNLAATPAGNAARR